MTSRLLSRRALGLGLVALLLMAAMVALGLWQLGVYDDHQHDDARARLDRAPVPLGEVIGPDDAFPSDGVSRPVTVTGRYLSNEEFTVRGSDTLDVAVHAENLREHRKGLLVDIVTEIKIGNDVAWHQVTTFLHQQRTSLSDEPKPPPQKQQKLPPPNSILRITAGQIRRYASVGGDHNPIHTSSIGAKLFGFPTAIAHGMFSAAAVLANIEGQLPNAVRYSVKFGKPIMLPATAGLYVDRVADGWDLSLRNLSKGYPHLTGEIRAL